MKDERRKRCKQALNLFRGQGDLASIISPPIKIAAGARGIVA